MKLFRCLFSLVLILLVARAVGDDVYAPSHVNSSRDAEISYVVDLVKFSNETLNPLTGALSRSLKELIQDRLVPPSRNQIKEILLQTKFTEEEYQRWIDWNFSQDLIDFNDVDKAALRECFGMSEKLKEQRFQERLALVKNGKQKVETVLLYNHWHLMNNPELPRLKTAVTNALIVKKFGPQFYGAVLTKQAEARAHVYSKMEVTKEPVHGLESKVAVEFVDEIWNKLPQARQLPVKNVFVPQLPLVAPAHINPPNGYSVNLMRFHQALFEDEGEFLALVQEASNSQPKFKNHRLLQRRAHLKEMLLQMKLWYEELLAWQDELLTTTVVPNLKRPEMTRLRLAGVNLLLYYNFGPDFYFAVEAQKRELKGNDKKGAVDLLNQMWKHLPD